MISLIWLLFQLSDSFFAYSWFIFSWNSQILIYFLFSFQYDHFVANRANFFTLWISGEVYFVLDTIWLIIWPTSVASPFVIICHHILSAIGWYLPTLIPPIAPWVTACFLVEVNTFFLIAKRYFHSNQSLRPLLTICFHITWILFRVVMYPALVYFFTSVVLLQAKIHGTYANLYSFGMVLVLFLTGLNMKWTLELYFKTSPKTKDGLWSPWPVR